MYALLRIVCPPTPLLSQNKNHPNPTDSTKSTGKCKQREFYFWVWVCACAICLWLSLSENQRQNEKNHKTSPCFIIYSFFCCCKITPQIVYSVRIQYIYVDAQHSSHILTILRDSYFVHRFFFLLIFCCCKSRVFNLRLVLFLSLHF